MKKPSRLSVVLIIVLVFSLIPSTGFALSLRSPPLGNPIVYNNYVVFSSRDYKMLMCIDLQGSKIWERTYPTHIRYSRRNDTSIAVQAGTNISVVDISSGKETLLFRTRTEHELVHFDGNGGVVYSQDDRQKHRYFRMLDPKSGAVLWENADIEDVSLVTEDMLICLTGKRDYISELSHYLTDAAVEAFDRKSGMRVWKRPLPKCLRGPWLDGVYLRPYIVINDNSERLICLRASDGLIVSTIDISKDYENRISDISSKDGLLMYMTDKVPQEPKKRHPKPHRTFVHFCSLPGLKEESVTELSTTDSMLFLTCYDKFVITETSSMNPQTLCFDVESGKRIWGKEHLGRSEPDNGKIYFSDLWDNKEHTALTARIGVIDIASGNETILYGEEIFRGTRKVNTLEIIETTGGRIHAASARELQDLKKDIIGLTTEGLDSRLPQNCMVIITGFADKPGIAIKQVDGDIKDYLRGDRSIRHRRIYQVEGAWEGQLFVEIKDNIVVSTKLLGKASE